MFARAYARGNDARGGPPRWSWAPRSPGSWRWRTVAATRWAERSLGPSTTWSPTRDRDKKKQEKKKHSRQSRTWPRPGKTAPCSHKRAANSHVVIRVCYSSGFQYFLDHGRRFFLTTFLMILKNFWIIIIFKGFGIIFRSLFLTQYINFRPFLL